MKFKKRKKIRRMRGSRTHGWAMKKHKGKGNRGGKGMSGTGKKAGQKKTFLTRYFPDYFGKQGITSRKAEKKKNKSINVGDIQEKYKPGEINLSKYKILGKGEIKDKFIIKARGFSKQAREKIEKAGGKAISKKDNKKEENIEEK